MLTPTLALEIHNDNVLAGWWTDLTTGEPLKRCHQEMKMLQITELSEAMEGYRKDLQDDKLPQYKVLHVELVDCLIRQLDVIGSLSGAVSNFLDFELVPPTDFKIADDLTIPQILLRCVGSILLSEIDAQADSPSLEHLNVCIEALSDVYQAALHLGVDVGDVMAAKRAFNKIRQDHKVENRLAEGGKKC